ncbi:MAG: tetratricopeptide repeat protein, partial [Cyanobacteria bacterium P01_A01_bin.84]
MLYRLKCLLATTALIYITLPTGIAFSHSEITDLERKGVSQQDSPTRLQAKTLTRKQLRKKALQLYRKGLKHYEKNKYQEALDNFQQALPIIKQIGDKPGEVATLNYIGQIYIDLRQYSNASKFLEQASIISGGTLPLIYIPYYSYTSQLPPANLAGIGNTLPNKPLSVKNGQSITLSQKLHLDFLSPVDIGNTFPRKTLPSNNIESTTPPQPPSVIPSAYLPFLEPRGNGNILLKKPLPSVSNITLEAGGIINISNTHGNEEDIGNTINMEATGKIVQGNLLNQQNQQNLKPIKSIINKIKKKNLNGIIKNNLGIAYLNQGEYIKAEKSINQALTFFRQTNDKAGQGDTFNNLGELYRHQSQYPKALQYLNQGLEIFKDNKNQLGIGTAFNNIGLVHGELGQHSQALKHYHESLKIRKKIKDEYGISSTLHNIGFVYDKLKQYDEALKFYQQALEVRHNVDDQEGKGTTLNNIGLVYNKLGQNTLALQHLKQSLSIFQKLNYPQHEANTLDSLGTVYTSQGRYNQASEAYQKSLTITRRIGNSNLERVILSNIGDLLAKQKQPKLAIIFYKQSVKITEEIRQGLRTLPREQQKSYAKTVADTYRRLADLLLKEDRVLEAQQVLDLLKVQELKDYLRKVRGSGENLTVLRPEQEILNKYNEQSKTAIQLGQELEKLDKIPESKRSSVQKQRINELKKLEIDLNQQFNQFSQREDIVQLLKQLPIEAQNQVVDIRGLDALRDDLRRLNAVLVYPLILDDRLELVITTPESPPLHRTVNVTRSELNQEIVKFRRALQNPNSDVKSSAQRLYKWLIKPLENDLNQAKPETIIYAPDGQLRYIPLAALHDENQWLIERYKINNITAKSLTDFTAKPKPLERVLAGAFVQGKHNIKMGERSFPFVGLPFTGTEVENLAKMIPQTKKLVDEQFSKNSTIAVMNNYTILHFATHAAVVPENAAQSFILFGNGDIATLEEIGNWTLNNVDLVVLSACETGLGGFGNGEEILGLGYQFQNRGVRATIAS